MRSLASAVVLPQKETPMCIDGSGRFLLEMLQFIKTGAKIETINSAVVKIIAGFFINGHSVIGSELEKVNLFSFLKFRL